MGRGNAIEERKGMEAQAQQQPAAATPGRWTAVTGHGEYDVMGDTAICRMYQDRALNSALTPDAVANARLIAAAVNACRGAGYTVEELERGEISRDLVELHEGRERIQLLLRLIDKLDRPEDNHDRATPRGFKTWRDPDAMPVIEGE